jgi:ribosomal protein L37AE/L43A
MIGEDYGDVWVCTDCYFAHHYGAYQQDFLADELGALSDEENLNGLVVELWYAGEDDEPVGGWHEIKVNGTLDHNREPLGRLRVYEIADNTCSDHYYGQNPEVDEDDYDRFTEACEQCGSFSNENGIREFDWSRCDGCGSPLGGHRYRLHLWMREDVKA